MKCWVKWVPPHRRSRPAIPPGTASPLDERPWRATPSPRRIRPSLRTPTSPASRKPHRLLPQRTGRNRPALSPRGELGSAARSDSLPLLRRIELFEDSFASLLLLQYRSLSEVENSVCKDGANAAATHDSIRSVFPTHICWTLSKYTGTGLIHVHDLSGFSLRQLTLCFLFSISGPGGGWLSLPLSSNYLPGNLPTICGNAASVLALVVRYIPRTTFSDHTCSSRAEANASPSGS